MNFYVEEHKLEATMQIRMVIHALTTRGQDVVLCELIYDEGAVPTEGMLAWEAEKARRVYVTRTRVEFV